jgi:hypothetical protein
MNVLLLSICVALLIVNDASSFLVHHHRSSRCRIPHHDVTVKSSNNNNISSNRASSLSSSSLFMAGFGSKDGSSNNKKDAKLKAKGQWDRYLDLKTCTKFTVGVRIKNDDSSTSSTTTPTNNQQWMEVGRIRSVDNAHTEIAIARQRALIAEHSKRLYPLLIPMNAMLEWGYISAGEKKVIDGSDDGNNDGGDAITQVWTIVDIKAISNTANEENIEKKIGFEGIPDRATGYYCFYNQGRIVESTAEVGDNKNSLRSQRTQSKGSGSDGMTSKTAASRGS